MSRERFTPLDTPPEEAADKALVPTWATEHAQRFHSEVYLRQPSSRKHTNPDINVPDTSNTSAVVPRFDSVAQEPHQPFSPSWNSLPSWYRKHNDRFAEPSHPYSRYDDLRQTYRYSQDPFWPRMSDTIDSMVGKSIRQYDPRVPDNLGCARFVSAVLERTYGLPIRDAGVDGLEASLKRYGFVAMPLSQAKPGDIIIGYRAPGEYGHAAIYLGNNEIANNNSFKRQISIDYINKFYAPEFQSVVAYRRLS